MSSSNSPAPSPSASTRKLNLRRSHSTLSQVENSQDVTVVEDTPAPKRAKQEKHQDVSEAKKNTPPSQAKRLSHVQVSPRPRSRSSGGGEGKVSPTHAPPIYADSKVERDVEMASGPALAPASEPQSQQQQQQQPQVQTAASVINTPSRSFAERVILTPRSIINQLKSLKDFIFNTPQLVIGREEQREIDDEMFHIRRGVFEAGLRGRKQDGGGGGGGSGSGGE